MELQLTGKRAIVTGASRGIGKAIALALAGEGVDLVLAARGEDALAATAREIAAGTGRRVVPIPTDTGNDASVRALVTNTVAALGGVDILVNCAAQPGSQRPVPPLERFDASTHFWPDMNVKVMGYLRCAQAVAPHMIAGGWGRIISVSGLAARQTGSITGSMRNVAVAAMTKNLADLLGPHGINVTVVHPGVTRTEATPEVLGRRADAEGVEAAEIERRMTQGNTVQRLIGADDVAYVVVMLASPRSVAINGDAIAAGGGTPQAIHY